MNIYHGKDTDEILSIDVRESTSGSYDITITYRDEITAKAGYEFVVADCEASLEDLNYIIKQQVSSISKTYFEVGV